MTTFIGPSAVDIYRAITLRTGLRMYATTGMKPNRTWTPTAMLRTAGHITGQTFKRGQYNAAITALTLWIEEHRA